MCTQGFHLAGVGAKEGKHGGIARYYILGTAVFPLASIVMEQYDAPENRKILYSHIFFLACEKLHRLFLVNLFVSHA